MLISCTFSIVGLHLLLLTHIVHSFVLLTANVDDVKKIARKFVSDSLAEKIADFIARATETMAKNMKISEENKNNADAQESSQVSAENKMYSVESHASDSQTAEDKSKEEIVLGKVTVKVPKKTLVEKKRHEFENPVTKQKPRKEPKSLHERSRYIVRTENKASLATEKSHSKISEEEDYNKMKESIQLVEDKFFSTPDGKTKNKKQKKKIRPYKLLSGFASVENEAAKSGIPDSKGTKDDERLFNVRAMDDKKVLSLPTAIRIKQRIENEKQTEKAATDIAQHNDITKDDKNTEMVATNESMHLIEKDEFDLEENKIIKSTEKVVTSGSRSFVAETSDKGENLWGKELPAHNHEVISQKSWF